MSAEQAHRAARRQFGNDLQLQERSENVEAFRLESMMQDLRFAARQLRKNPGFACTAILVLALGNTTPGRAVSAGGKIFSGSRWFSTTCRTP